MNKNDNYILGLDIGSSKICATIGKIDANLDLDFCGLGTCITAGLKKGQVVDVLALKKAIEKAIMRAECIAGVMPTQVVTNVPLYGVEFINTKEFVLSKNADKKISLLDKKRALLQMKERLCSSEKAIMHLIPTLFLVDGKQVISLEEAEGEGLEVQAAVVLADVENIVKITQILNQLNLKVKGIVYDSLSQAEVLLSEEEKAEGCYLLDIGGQFSELSFFKNDFIQQAVIVPIGGETITSDIAYCLKVSTPEAERLKMIYGDIDLLNIDQEAMVEIMLKDNSKRKISQSLLCQIIEARIQEMLKLILKQMDFSADLGCRKLVLGGGSSKLSGLKDYLIKKLGVKVRLGSSEQKNNMAESLGEAFSVGSILYALKTGVIKYQDNQTKFSLDNLKKKVFRMRRFLMVNFLIWKKRLQQKELFFTPSSK